MRQKMFLCGMLMVCFSMAVFAQADTTMGSGRMHKKSTQTQTDKTMTNQSGANKMNMGSSFVKEAAMGGMMEVQLGNVAKEKASSQDVKNFGDMMVTDHSKANDELKSIAVKNNMTLPTKLMGKNKQHVDHLSSLSGNEFDKEYMDMMVKDHQEDVAAFEKASKNEKNSDVKDWTEKTLPTLKKHLAKAKEIDKALNTVSRSK